MMKWIFTGVALLTLATSCVPTIVHKDAELAVPERYVSGVDSLMPADTVSTGAVSWRSFYKDTNLLVLIDSALQRNRELNIVTQEIIIAQNEVETRKGEYLPFVNVRAGAGVDKAGRYTRNGAVEDQLEVAPGKKFPDPVPSFGFSADVTWEVDIWKRLRNATKSAAMRYLSSIEGMNFVVTNIVSEIAMSYYELTALDNLLEAIDANIAILNNALNIVRQQKEAAKTTELAVKKFEAEVLRNQSHRYEVLQRIVETENRINFLVGRYPQRVKRDAASFLGTSFDSLSAGMPTQLLQNRPDVKQAEMGLQAAELDVDVARAKFYPSLNITAGAGYSSYSTRTLVTTPESMIYGLAGELMMPLINRKAITAAYVSSGARQIQAAFNYEKTVLNAYIEVSNQLAKIENMSNSVNVRRQQVEALTQSVDISNSLYLSARADYMEVLMTQRDALEAKMELIETKLEQLRSYVTIYQALGGGWH